MSPLAVGFDYAREYDGAPMMGLRIIELSSARADLHNLGLVLDPSR